MLRSLRVRLTLWYVILLAATLAVFSVALYVALRESLYDNLEESIEVRADIVAAQAVVGGQLDGGNVSFPGDPFEGEEFVRVYDGGGDIVFDNAGAGHQPALDPAGLATALGGRQDWRDDDTNGADLRVLLAPIRAEGEVVGAVEAGLTKVDVKQTLNELLLVIAIAYAVALVVTVGGGWFLASRALSPIDRVTRVARKISAEDLSQRLDLQLPDDEVGRLARTFDEMIARLDAAFSRQRQFTADASHELRTPLTAIKGQTEVALQREREPEEYRETLHIVNSEVDRMIRLVASLLTLARADAASIPLNREQLGVQGLVLDAVEAIRPAAEEKGVTLAVSAPEPPSTPGRGATADINADEDLVLQLLLNLLDNAVKYTPPGGRVQASWRDSEGGVEIAVADNGPGITPEHLPHVFERFYRIDRARSRSDGGAGLGLSISRWIAEAHGGTLRAESTPGEGATFIVWLPQTPPSP